MNPTKKPLLCRLGLHNKTIIPRDVLNSARAAGLRSVPLWYAGGQESWCQRCGQSDKPRKKTLEDLVREVGNDHS